jgi:hypothetical protein
MSKKREEDGWLPQREEEDGKLEEAMAFQEVDHTIVGRPLSLLTDSSNF